MLEAVREMRMKLAAEERRLLCLKRAAQDLVPIRDGLPKSKNVTSRTERLALKIIECEHELADLREELAQAEEILTDVIARLPHQKFLRLYFLEGCSLLETARLLRITLKRAFLIRQKILDAACQV